MSSLEETRDIIARLRAERASLGDTETTTTTPKVKLARIGKRKIAQLTVYLYIFLLGSLFTGAISGQAPQLVSFIVLAAVLSYQILRE